MPQHTTPPSDSAPSIQLATLVDAEACSEIERAASVLYRDTDHAWLAGSAASVEVYADAASRGDLIVARPACDGAPAALPVAFILMRTLGPDALYIGELAVLPTHQRHRLGARLLDAAEDVARSRGLRWMVLRTFTAVPWNAPYYRRLGFGAPPPGLAEETLAEMTDIAAMEGRHGLSERVREFMARPVRRRAP